MCTCVNFKSGSQRRIIDTLSVQKKVESERKLAKGSAASHRMSVSLLQPLQSPSLGPFAQEHLHLLTPKVSRKHCRFLCAPWRENFRNPGHKTGGSLGGYGAVWPGHCITKTVGLEAVTWARVWPQETGMAGAWEHV